MEFLNPTWPAPAVIQARVTTRQGGISMGDYASLNLASHVGDHPEAVRENRRRLSESLGLPQPPLWICQVHGVRVVDAGQPVSSLEADAVYANQPNQICAVLTADCLPLLICDRQGKEVAAIHAGWRGLAAGVIEAALQRFHAQPDDLLVWLGPAIGPKVFEVGEEVRDVFVRHHDAAVACFSPTRPGHYLADLYALARLRLSLLGIAGIYGGDFCTYTEADRFFSYRRNSATGRMATLIWMAY
ncbi:MAG: peptidoglycan editing factor PgeF [Pseudomonadales bacterium]|nr:peptidoglycan editing factor PgeF [Pseudomonadales bacterium]